MIYWAPIQKEQVEFEDLLRTAYLPNEELWRRIAFVANGSLLDYFEGSTDACSERMLRYFIQELNSLYTLLLMK